GAHRRAGQLHRRGQGRTLQVRPLPLLMGTTSVERAAGGAQLLDGKAVAAKVRARVAERAAAFAARCGRRPGLAVVQVGEEAASSVYVRNKRPNAQEAGYFGRSHDRLS